MTRWNQRMAKIAFRRSKFRRLAWGDGDPYPYTPRATFRYQWDDWPMWEKMWHLAVGVLGIEFAVWAYYSKLNSRMRLRREAQELMILEGETFPSDIQPDRH
ncbi:putative ESSS subunit of NADH:ubiquinone oxidoreductase (complex I) [Leishmania naiffi]|uniref:NADH dehydrogenase [ubiquinone] 1 beta subcomplex subunit 11, mitochondrial n=1 Tax=Leishmania naiffi TaxID=5678 RepID=A0AAW3CAY7_9TRYP